MRKTSCRGLTLIEVIIAMGMALLLLTFLLKLYLNASYSQRLQNALIHIQDNARTSLAILNTSIQQAGYIGCLRLTSDHPRLSYSQYSINLHNKLVGIGAHEIIIRHALFPAATLKKSSENQVTLYADVHTRFSSGDILLISDCKHAELFQAANVSIASNSQKITAASPLQFDYSPYAEIARFEIEHYYAAKTKHTHQDGSPIYALFKEDKIKNRVIEVVDDITALNFLFTLHRPGHLEDVPASAVEDWSKVVGVTIQLETQYSPLKKIWHSYIALQESP
jgi:type IV pilus assembly protein PilW